MPGSESKPGMDSVSFRSFFLWRNVRIRRDMAEVERIQFIVVFSYCGKRFTLKKRERECIFKSCCRVDWEKTGKKVECFIKVVGSTLKKTLNIYYNLNFLKCVDFADV